MSENEFAATMAANGQRSNKFRHVFGEAPKQEKRYLEVQKPHTSGESSYLTANHKFFAVSKSTGGGPIYVRNLENLGRFAANTPTIKVHKGYVLDLDFHPFIPNIIASSSDDCSSCITQFPIDGLSKDVTQPVALLKGHTKKVVLNQFNPSADSIFATASFDKTVRVWDIQKQETTHKYTGAGDNIYSLEWNKDGSRLGISSKDKKIHLFDPRDPDAATSFESFGGTKSSKVFWLPNLGWIGATGFTKAAARKVKFWDLKNLDKILFETKIDNASSVMIPKYDYDTGLLFVFGKGDGTVIWSEIVNDNKKFYTLGGYRSNEPQKGGGFVPKKGLDVWKCEIARFLKLTKDSVIPIPLVVPRKAGADVFQADIYPEAFAGKSALTSEQWMKGENKEYITMSLDPEKRNDVDDGKNAFVAKKTYEQLEAEIKELKQKLAEYEKKLGISPEKAEDKDKEQKEANADDAKDAE